MKSFKSILYFLIISLISVFVVAGIYLGFRVYDANLNGLLPLDSEKLRADMYNVINNPIFTNTIISCFCIVYYLIRKKDVCKKNEIVCKKNFISFTTLKVIFFSISLGFVLRFMVGGLILGLNQLKLINLESMMLESTTTQSWEKELVSLLIIGILTPIAEELLFRKILISDLLKTYSYKKTAIIAYLCFVVLHTGTNIIYALFGGALLIYLYIKYGNVCICIISHSAMNIIGNINLSFLDDVWLYLIVCFCLGIMGYYIYCQYMNRNQSKKTSS